MCRGAGGEGERQGINPGCGDKRSHLPRDDEHKITSSPVVLQVDGRVISRSSVTHDSGRVLTQLSLAFLPTESMSRESRYRVKSLYKQLLYLGRDWPQGYSDYFKPRLHAAFMKQRDLAGEEEVNAAIARGEFMVKELETFWFLKKYRAVKRSYGSRSG